MNIATLNRWRHRIPFWWWLTYDAIVGVVIVVGISPSDPAFWLGFAVLAVAVAIDAVEFVVKRPRSDGLSLISSETNEP